LISELSKPNTKLCVLLEPTELSSNNIVKFCDDTFGDRQKWVHDAVFLMTKFDNKMRDVLSASKTNEFFEAFHEIGIYPHLVERLKALTCGSWKDAKKFLKQDNEERIMRKNPFLPEGRSSMINGEETKIILQRTSEYMFALLEFNLIMFRFQINHYMFIGFKEELGKSFRNKATEANWEELVQQDPTIKKRLSELDDRINALNKSLGDVNRMYQGI
jgi:hypothetical protein